MVSAKTSGMLSDNSALGHWRANFQSLGVDFSLCKYVALGVPVGKHAIGVGINNLLFIWQSLRGVGVELSV